MLSNLVSCCCLAVLCFRVHSTLTIYLHAIDSRWEWLGLARIASFRSVNNTNTERLSCNSQTKCVLCTGCAFCFLRAAVFSKQKAAGVKQLQPVSLIASSNTRFLNTCFQPKLRWFFLCVVCMLTIVCICCEYTTLLYAIRILTVNSRWLRERERGSVRECGNSKTLMREREQMRGRNTRLGNAYMLYAFKQGYINRGTKQFLHSL